MTSTDALLIFIKPHFLARFVKRLPPLTRRPRPFGANILFAMSATSYVYFINPLFPDELRNEITLHTCYKLVNKVALFKDLPAKVVGSVLGCLHPEVYLTNDSVLHAGDIGDCMYFIANGTVAVYSLKGVEVFIEILSQ